MWVIALYLNGMTFVGGEEVKLGMSGWFVAISTPKVIIKMTRLNIFWIIHLLYNQFNKVSNEINQKLSFLVKFLSHPSYSSNFYTIFFQNMCY